MANKRRDEERELRPHEPAETARLVSGASGFLPEHPRDPEEGLKPRPPRPSDVLPPPKAPPTAPDLPCQLLEKAPPSPETRAAGLSPAGHRLVQRIAGNLPAFSSFEFSLNLADHLATYWRERRDTLLLDENGFPEQDYELVAQRAHLLQGSGPTSPRESILDAVRRVADELDADKVAYYAPGLQAEELRMVQAAHDLAVALIHYKLSSRVSDRADRAVMLTSTAGALGCIEAALGRFGSEETPAVIRSYAQVLEMKIRAEARMRS